MVRLASWYPHTSLNKDPVNQNSASVTAAGSAPQRLRRRLNPRQAVSRRTVHAVGRTNTNAKGLALEIVAPHQVIVEAPRHIAEADASLVLALALHPTYLQTVPAVERSSTSARALVSEIVAPPRAGVAVLPAIAALAASFLSGLAPPGLKMFRRTGLAEARTNTRAPTLLSGSAAALVVTVVVL